MCVCWALMKLTIEHARLGLARPPKHPHFQTTSRPSTKIKGTTQNWKWFDVNTKSFVESRVFMIDLSFPFPFERLTRAIVRDKKVLFTEFPHGLSFCKTFFFSFFTLSVSWYDHGDGVDGYNLVWWTYQGLDLIGHLIFIGDDFTRLTGSREV